MLRLLVTPLLLLAAGMVTLGAAEGKTMTDAELRQVVRSISHPQAQCVNNTGGMLTSCGSGSYYGKVYVYVLNSRRNVINVDVDISANATTGGMIALQNYMREVVGKLGLSGSDYERCTDINAGRRQTSSFSLAAYDLDCTTYTSMSQLKFEMRFSQR